MSTVCISCYVTKYIDDIFPEKTKSPRTIHCIICPGKNIKCLKTDLHSDGCCVPVKE